MPTTESESRPACYRAKYLAPIDSPVIEDGCLLVRNGQILDIGPTVDVARRKPADASIIDLGEVLLTPGFTNAHAHLELTCYRGQFHTAPLSDWIRQLIDLRRKPEAIQNERAGIDRGIRESLAAGVTCVGDITRTGQTTPFLARAPIRGVSFLELISGAKDPPNSAASLAQLFDELRLLESNGMLRLGVSPHAPSTVLPHDFDFAIKFAGERSAPVTMHFLETISELSELQELRKSTTPDIVGHPDSAQATGAERPTADFVLKDDMYRPSMLLAHVNYPDPDFLDRITTGGASVAWCPRAHRYFQHRPHRWREMIARGINVCVGTDSAICVPTLSILDELREIRTVDPDAEAEVLFRMATLNGARAPGFDDRIGSLTPGKRADFVALEMNAHGDPLEAALKKSAKIIAVFIDGCDVLGAAAGNS